MLRHYQYQSRGIVSGELSTASQKELCYIIYYPEEVLKEKNYNDEDWMILLNQLVRVTRYVSSKYTRSKVRKAMPKEYAYILEELLYQYDESGNKQEYFDSIFSMIIDLNLAYDFAVVLSYLIQRFVVDHLHILGDIYDRGPRPDLIIEALMKAPSLDIQWGNHDLIWMGAMARNFACLAIVLRITLRYGHTRLLEDDYGINLNRLRKFSEKYYQDNDEFRPRGAEKDNYTVEEQIAISKMHQAIAIIQFKLEGKLSTVDQSLNKVIAYYLRSCPKIARRLLSINAPMTSLMAPLIWLIMRILTN